MSTGGQQDAGHAVATAPPAQRTGFPARMDGAGADGDGTTDRDPLTERYLGTAGGRAPEPVAPVEEPRPAPLGPSLRAAREAAGRTVEQVCARTRIRPNVLRDLERGDLTSSGGAVYARGHVRTVAQAVGADPAPLLASLDAQVGAPPDVPVVLAPVAPDADPAGGGLAGALRLRTSPAPERRGPHWGVAVVAALAVLVLLLSVGALTGRGDRGTTTAGPVLASQPASPSRSAQAATPRSTRAAAPTGGARLRVQAVKGQSWLRVQGTTGTLFEGLVAAGQPPREFTDRGSLRLLVGNAAALAVACGSTDVAPSGAVGAVRTFTCSARGLAPA